MEAVAQPLTTPAKSLEVYDRFLAEEAALKLPEVELADRARFHFAVRQCALAWSRHPRAGFHITRTRHALALSFDGPIEDKQVSVITFRSACEHGDYRFQGFNLATLPATLSPIARGNLQRLKELYEAALPQTFQSDGAVTVLIKRQPSIDFLPILDEARRLLDDGNQDFPPIDPRELMIVPAEHARMFVGKTTVIPIVRPKVEPPKPAAKASQAAAVAKAKSEDHPHADHDSDDMRSESDPDSDSDSDSDSETESDSETDSTSETETKVAKTEAKASTKSSPKAASPVGKSAPPVKGAASIKAGSSVKAETPTKPASTAKSAPVAKTAAPSKVAAPAKSANTHGQAGVKASQAPAKAAPKTSPPSPSSSSKPVAKTEPKSDSKPTAKAEARPAAKAEAKPAAKAMAKPAAKIVTEPANKPTPKSSAKPVAKATTKAAVKPAAKTAAKPAPKPAAKKKGK